MLHDVVIAGAGIGGAVLALDLARRGWRVAIVEREAATARIVRPEILWGATPRALERLGVGAAVREAAEGPVEGIEVGGEKPWLRVGAEDFAAAGVEAYSTDPGRTREIVADAAVATGRVEILRGVTVEGLLREGGRIAGLRGRRGDETVEVAGRLVVGDDGGHSVVGAEMGASLALTAFPIDFVTAGIARWPLPPRRARVWLAARRDGEGPAAAAFIPWPAGRGILLMPMAPAAWERLAGGAADDFWPVLARITPAAGALREQLEFPRDFRRIARPFGHASSYVADGAALLGDAAHSMTPAGGQGANAAIWDAFALAEIADGALRAGDLSRARLLAYERLRRPANARSIAFSRNARRALRAASGLPLAFALPAAMKTLGALNWPKRQFLRLFANAFVHAG